MNTELKKNDKKNDFKNNFFKVINNAVLGKNIGIMRKHRDIQACNKRSKSERFKT